MLTNASGGLDPSFGPGTLMLIRDHMNLTGQNPLIGPNADSIGPRFPDLTEAWSPRLRARLRAAGGGRGRDARRGHLRRPDRAQLRDPGRGPDVCALGGHAVGMSTVLECIAARWAGLEVCGISLVTNAGAGYTRRAADPRGGARRRRRGRAADGPPHPPLRRGLTLAGSPASGGAGSAAVDRSSRPAARAALAFSAQASRTWSLCGRIGQWPSRLFISSQ